MYFGAGCCNSILRKEIRLNSQQKLWLTVKEAAPLIGASKDAIYRDIRQGTFPFRTLEIGGLIRISAKEIGAITDREPNSEARPQGETLAEAA